MRSSEERRHVRSLRELPLTVAAAVVLALVIKAFLIQAFLIPSGSMASTLDPGNRVLVNRLAFRVGEPARGDIVVFNNPHPTPGKEFLIKRIAGLPGETIRGVDGHVVVDPDGSGPLSEEMMNEPYLAEGVTTDPFDAVNIPDDEYFMLGDNRGDSDDSRFSLGTIDRDEIVGEAFVIIWPPADWGGL